MAPRDGWFGVLQVVSSSDCQLAVSRRFES
jgi:hypothetical protein